LLEQGKRKQHEVADMIFAGTKRKDVTAGCRVLHNGSFTICTLQDDCLAAHLHRIKIFSHIYRTICKPKTTIMNKDHLLVCPKLDHTSKELSKLYGDARRLME
jgi:hypothetical protein